MAYTLNKKYIILLIGVILLASGSTIATASFLSIFDFVYENAVFFRQPIAPTSIVNGSFTLEQNSDVRLSINNNIAGNTLEVIVHNDADKEIFKMNVNEKIEEVLKGFESSIYKASVKNLGDEYDRVTVAVAEVDGKDRTNIFFSLANTTFVGVIIAISGFIITIVGSVILFRYKKI